MYVSKTSEGKRYEAVVVDGEVESKHRVRKGLSVDLCETELVGRGKGPEAV